MRFLLLLLFCLPCFSEIQVVELRNGRLSPHNNSDNPWMVDVVLKDGDEFRISKLSEVPDDERAAKNIAKSKKEDLWRFGEKFSNDLPQNLPNTLRVFNSEIPNENAISNIQSNRDIELILIRIVKAINAIKKNGG